MPEGAPAEIVRSCKAEAEQSQSLSSDNLQRQQQQRDNVPGSADDLIQEVKEAKQSAKSGQPPGDVLFYECLESNGVELEPAQRAVIDEWSAR
ncbi:MAG TPA: hypothetical protein PKK10_03325 [Woeseiaceae bacterium]|nr:hypothetical protein [Woeseiaceae bacterium]